MSAISGISSVTQAAFAVAARQAGPATPSVKKDSDGDFDGTRIGQSDPMDFGKGLQIDTRA